MDLSTRSEIINNIIEYLTSYESLFDPYIEVYLFGSMMDSGRTPNDIDILLIYNGSLNTVIANLDTIRNHLSKICDLPVDLTVLSVAEEKDTQFLKRLNKYLRLK